jgi:hypothetical protein
MSAIWIVVILVFLMFGPSAIAALVEKRMVWPYAPLGEKEITSEGLNPGDNAAANAYIMRFIHEATSEGFQYLECMRDAKGSKYKIIYHFLISPDKYTLAIIGGGKILGIGVKGTWLYSKSNNEGCYYSVDNQSGLVTDISGFWRDKLLFDDNFAALYAKHQKWTDGNIISRKMYSNGAELDEHRKALTYRCEYMEKTGYIRFLDSDKQFWKYTLKGAIKVSVCNITKGVLRHLLAGKKPK